MGDERIENAPSDVYELLDQDETLLLYMKQKKYHPSINKQSIAVTSKRIIFRKPSTLLMKKSYTDYSFADITNVIVEKGPLRSTIRLNLKMDATDLAVQDIPNDEAQEAFRLIRQGIDRARSQYRV